MGYDCYPVVVQFEYTFQNIAVTKAILPYLNDPRCMSVQLLAQETVLRKSRFLFGVRVLRLYSLKIILVVCVKVDLENQSIPTVTLAPNPRGPFVVVCSGKLLPSSTLSLGNKGRGLDDSRLPTG